MEHTRLPFPFVTYLNMRIKGSNFPAFTFVSSTTEWLMRAFDGAATGKAPAPLLKTVISHGVAARWSQAGYGEK